MEHPSIRACSIAMLLAAAFIARAEDIKTIDGRDFPDVSEIKAKPDGLVLFTADGSVKVPFSNLPEEVRRRYHYDPLAAGLYVARGDLVVTVTGQSMFHLTDPAQMKDAVKKAKAEGKLIGVVLLWKTMLDKPVNTLSGPAGDSATALGHLYASFHDSLVLAYVFHENEFGKWPPIVSKGMASPDEGGLSPSMTVVDPDFSCYICQVPMGGEDSDGKIRAALYQDRIRVMRGWLDQHPLVPGGPPSAPPPAPAQPTAPVSTSPAAPTSGGAVAAPTAKPNDEQP